jgi:hypothetical protein
MLKKLIAKRNVAKTARPVLNRAVARVVKSSVEQLEERKMFASDLALGINANNLWLSNYDQAVKLYRDTGTNAVRLWCTIEDYNSRSEGGVFKFAKKLHNDGFDVTLTLSPRNGKMPASAQQVKDYVNFVASWPGMRESVDRWEIGNEPDHDQYWQGSLTQYVNNFLKPASEVLRGMGEKVVSAGPSWNPADVQTMIDAGMLKYVDYVGYHPYRNSVAELKRDVAKVKDMVGSKPLVATEWNARGSEGDKVAWAAKIESYWPTIRDNFEIAHYFATFKVNSMAGPAGLINPDGSKNTLFYNVYDSFEHTMNGGGGTVGGSNGGSTNNPAPAPTPTNSVKPAVTTVSLIDANTDSAVSGYSTVNSGETIDLAKFSTRSLNFLAKGNSNTDSVKFTFNGKTRIETNEPWAAFGDDQGDMRGQALAPGTYTLTTQAFSGDNATGTAGSVQTFTLNVIDSGNTPSSTTSKPALRGYAIIDAKTGLAIPGYSMVTSSKTIKLSSLPTRNIQIIALTNAAASSVKIDFSGRGTRIENTASYTVFANSKGAASAWYAMAGSYNLKSTAYSLDNAKGTAGNTLGITLKFV